jgi:hypothetical protein
MEARPVTKSYIGAENSYLGFYWFLLFVIGLTIVSLGCALFGYGIVFEAQAGYRIYHTFYSYMLMFPLLGILIVSLFGMAATDRAGKTISFVLTVAAVLYLLLVAGIIGYMIFDWVAHCNATTAAAHCWNGLSVRWQWMWVFWSIVVQFLLMILELILGLKIINIAGRLRNAGVVESILPRARVEGRQKSPMRLSQFDPMTEQFIREVEKLN